MTGEPPGLQAIRDEMARQGTDALDSFEGARAGAARVTESLRRTGRFLLLGMGGSHWVNRTAAVLYRRAGVDAAAEVLSEVLLASPPPAARTALIASQSGASGEVVRYLTGLAGDEERFGLTLDPDSPLGRTVPCLAGAGGPERAFAATRSVLITHALHLAVLEAIGVDPREALAALREPDRPDITAAVRALRDCATFVLSGRGALAGVAESGALCLMELARRPALGLEGGQLRHGPLEMLSTETGVLLLRGPGPSAELTRTLALDCRNAGSPTVVLDGSGVDPVEGVVTVPFRPCEGMAAVLGFLPALQDLLVTLAAGLVADVGTPLRSTKVTTTP